jgi:hypothetical protein
MENLIKDEKEVFYFGQVVTEPILKWRNSDKPGQFMTGWECRFQTNSTLEGDEVVLDIQLVYDLQKWEPVHNGQFLKLSMKHNQMSKTSPSGSVTVCHVVIRK